MLSMILGANRRSKAFYESNMNLTVTSEGFVNYFIESDGFFSMRLFLKNVALKSNSIETF